MQSNTIDYVLPDGTKLTEKAIAAFNKDGYNVLATTADQVQSGNTITHISLQKDGMFSTIVDENEWNYIKNEFLIPSIKEGGETTNSFCQAQESVIATAKPYRELALRPNDLEALQKNYQAFLNSLSATVESQPEMTQEPVVETPIENTVVEEAPVAEENNIISDIPQMIDVQPMEVNEHQDIVPPEDITINNDAIPGFESTPIVEQPIMVESSVINDFSNQEENKLEEVKEEPVAVVSEKPQDVFSLMENIPKETTETIETTTVNENNANIIDFPKLEQENEKTDSVTDSYSQRFNDLMNRVSQKSQQFQDDMNQLKEEGEQILAEIKDLRTISMQAYENAQNVPGIEQEKDNELSLTKAA